ncbi:hypothetical protein SPH9361_03629 [Sphingobium sp. CECT 9361]|nr:hypothetical protein SPH9361_03629 [Sphingobium sp. CECT 9361]
MIKAARRKADRNLAEIPALGHGDPLGEDGF